MTIDPPLPTIGLVLFAGLIGMLVVGFVFGAAAKRGVAAIVFVGGVVMTALFYAGFSPLQPIKSAFVDTFNAERLSNQSPIAAPVAPSAPKAEIASDEELASIASAPPKIELDSEIVIGDEADAVKSGRPDWIDAELNDNQKLITSGPFTAKDTCVSDTQNQIAGWLWSRRGYRSTGDTGFTNLGIDVSQAIKSQYEEVRDTSVGEMHLLYTLAEVTPEVEAQIAQSLANAAAQVAQKRGVRTVTFAGAGVLSLVALTHVVLRSGGRKAKNSAP